MKYCRLESWKYDGISPELFDLIILSRGKGIQEMDDKTAVLRNKYIEQLAGTLLISQSVDTSYHASVLSKWKVAELDKEVTYSLSNTNMCTQISAESFCAEKHKNLLGGSLAQPFQPSILTVATEIPVGI